MPPCRVPLLHAPPPSPPQYVVDSDPFLLEYLDTHTLPLELCVAKGYDYEVVGLATVALRQVRGGEDGEGRWGT
jgi:hypothetical protein